MPKNDDSNAIEVLRIITNGAIDEVQACSGTECEHDPIIHTEIECPLCAAIREHDEELKEKEEKIKELIQDREEHLKQLQVLHYIEDILEWGNFCPEHNIPYSEECPICEAKKVSAEDEDVKSWIKAERNLKRR